MNKQLKFHVSVGTLLRCITFVAFFTVGAKLFYEIHDPIAQRSLRFCWSAMGVGALLCIIILSVPRSAEAETVRFRVLQSHRTPRDHLSEVLVCMGIAAVIVVSVSLFCSWTSGLRKNRGPLPISPMVLGALSGFVATLFLAITTRQQALLGEEGIDGIFPFIPWKDIESACWIDRKRGIMCLKRVGGNESPGASIDVEVPERSRVPIEQFLRTKTKFVDKCIQ